MVKMSKIELWGRLNDQSSIRYSADYLFFVSIAETATATFKSLLN